MNGDPYYLAHFRFALGWLHDRYGDLLSTRESEFVREFAALPRDSQCLLVRFIMRRGQQFRASKINYLEVGSVARACGPLVELEWVDPRPPLTIQELTKLLTRAELAATFPHLPSSLGKAQALAFLSEIHAEQRSFEDWRGSVAEAVYRVSVAPLCTQLRLLFFGNFRQEWSEFVLADLGVFRYEVVPFCAQSRAFHARKDIEDFYRLYECRRLLANDAPLADVCALLPAAALNHEWLEVRRARLLLQVARRHELAGEREAALSRYRQCDHPDARWRMIRLLQIDARLKEAHECALTALAGAESAAEIQKLSRIAHRLERRLGMRSPVKKRAVQPERLDLIVPAPCAGESVERIALKMVSLPDAPVYYVENSLINSLFGLLCWEAIFAPISGAFFHAFHAGPTDLFSRNFRRRRAASFERCLQMLDSDAYKIAIKQNFHAKRGIQSFFVAWGMLEEELLDMALSCIPSGHLRQYFERLLSDLPDNRSGLPDLVQFWVYENRYRMIEVKGPGDRLQDNQQRWMEFCIEQSLPVAICHVRWAAVQ